MDETTQLVGLVCEHQELVATILGVVGVGSVVSWFQNHLPAPIAHVANLAGFNWNELVPVAKAIAVALNTKGTKPHA